MVATIGLHIGAAHADAVTDWSGIATRTVVAALPTERPAFGLQMAMTQAAIYDAVNSIDRSYRPLLVRPTQPTLGASKEAAAVAAAYKVLIALFPSQAAALLTDYTNSLAAIPDGMAKTRGISIGTEVASKVMAARASDGRLVDAPYAYGTGAGVYQATATPAPPSPVTPWLAKVKPFVLKKPWQFRPEGPPDLDSEAYTEALDEVARLGKSNSTERAPEETELALFHTMNPNAFWGNNLKSIVIAQDLSLPENARLLAQLWVSAADAAIACWDGKYHFNFWRPQTAIRNADADGNDDTAADPGWTPLAATPPHPEYPSAHSCITGATMEVLRHFAHTKRLELTFVSTVPIGGVPTTLTRRYHHIDDFIDDVMDARVFGGMHFRAANEDGEVLGKRVARWVSRTEFQPLRRHYPFWN
ncbi:MAG: vanadium-dependent haloperoxidase [Steroidobacteraceae bacterium]